MAVEKPKRALDKMGRIVIPKDIRKAIGLVTDDEVTFEVSGTGILMLPVTPHCTLCGSKYELTEYCDKYVCKSCIRTLKML